MAWFVTGMVDEYLAAAGPFLRAEPVRNTVILSVTEGLRVRAAGTDRVDRRLTRVDQPLFGWWQPDGPSSGAVRGAFLATPGFPVFLSSMSSVAAAGLAGELATAGRGILGVTPISPTPPATRCTSVSATARWRTGWCCPSSPGRERNEPARRRRGRRAAR